MQSMQDPSAGIPAQLLQHVHLISSHQYPFMPRMQINQAYGYLFEAPKIVSKHATMSWQYLSAPQDGRVFLTWNAPRSNDMFPSDGYIWAGPEERMTQEFGGYTIEVAIQYAGYRPGVDHMACHQRHRYRLIQKNPNVNANPPDRNLWIVHYSQAEPHKTVPVSQVAISRLQQGQHQQRHYIEQQGQLEHREFMLHDRERWPVLKMTGQGIRAVQNAAQPPNPAPHAATHMANPRFGGQHYQQQAQAAVGPSPAKRQRTSTGGAEPVPNPLREYHDVDAEEEFAFGDYFDTLSQRDVSRSRFIQHHEWMEEIFSSPYATHQIQPAYLGFGLIGELAGLTDGIFETVQDAVKIYNGEIEPDDKTLVAPKVAPDQLAKFEQRVNEYMDAGQAELKRMKEDHAKKMEQMRRGKSLTAAEKRLRNARWIAPDGTKAVMNGLVSGTEHAEDADVIVGEVESMIGQNLTRQHDLKTVERGGLRERIVQQPEPAAPIGSSSMTAQQNQYAGQASGLSGQPHAPGQSVAQPAQQAAQAATGQMQPQTTAGQGLGQSEMAFDNDEEMGTLDTSNFEIEGMDLEMGDDADFDFNEDALGDGALGQDGAVGGATGITNAPSTTTQQIPSASANAPGPTSLPDAAATERAVGNGGAGSNNNSNQPSYQPTPGSNSAFDEFTAGEDDAGGLIDFGAGGDGDDPGMESSAFGDAFHAADDGGEQDGA